MISGVPNSGAEGHPRKHRTGIGLRPVKKLLVWAQHKKKAFIAADKDGFFPYCCRHRINKPFDELLSSGLAQNPLPTGKGQDVGLKKARPGTSWRDLGTIRRGSCSMSGTLRSPSTITKLSKTSATSKRSLKDRAASELRKGLVTMPKECRSSSRRRRTRSIYSRPRLWLSMVRFSSCLGRLNSYRFKMCSLTLRVAFLKYMGSAKRIILNSHIATLLPT